MNDLKISYYSKLYKDTQRGRKMMKEHFSTEDVFDGAKWTNIQKNLPQHIIEDLNDDTPLPEYPSFNKQPRVGKEYQHSSFPEIFNSSNSFTS